MKDQKGFTLVEVVIASMLLGMVFLSAFPCLSAGYQIIKKEQTNTEAQIIGDRAFDRVLKEVQSAGTMYAGIYEEDSLYEENLGDSEFSKLGFDIEVTSESMDGHWINLTVILKKEETVIYQRTEIRPLLKVGFVESVPLEGE